MGLRVNHQDRSDTIVIENVKFRVWWRDCRPFDVRIETGEGQLTTDMLRAFIAWCDAQPPVKREV